MKFILSILLLVSVCFSTIAQTNSPLEVNIVQEAKKTVYTNMNHVIIDMLSGVKDASGEIYGASKYAIRNSVDFVAKEAPEVVQQFVLWRMFKSITWISIWVVTAGIVLFFANKLRLYQSKASTRRNYDDITEREVTTVFKWILSVGACIILILGVGTYVFEVVKIKVAPKFYIVEYIIDTVKPGQNITRN